MPLFDVHHANMLTTVLFCSIIDNLFITFYAYFVMENGEMPASVNIKEAQQENRSYTIEDLARQIAEQDPKTYGTEGELPLLTKEKQNGVEREVVNKKNFIEWMRQQIFFTDAKEKPDQSQQTAILYKISPSFFEENGDAYDFMRYTE